MKEKTIDYVLRTTWLAVQKMYNEEASKFEATIERNLSLSNTPRFLSFTRSRTL